MILQCPSCGVSYNVADAAIGIAGRTVRCKQCAHEWYASLPPVVMPEIPEFASIPVDKKSASMDRGKTAVADTISPPWLIGGLVASFVVALVTSLFVYQPAWFGFGMDNPIVMTDLSLASQKSDKGIEYAVSGKFVNMSGQYVKPSGIRITLVDKDGNKLKQWDPQVPNALGPQELFPVNYGPLKTSFASADRLVIDLGSSLQLMLRRKP